MRRATTGRRVALVTGASRGIGRAAAVALAASGAHVVALARTQGGLEELDDEIRALRPRSPAQRPSFRWICATSPQSIGWEKRSIVAGAGLTPLSAMRASSASCRLSTTSIRRPGTTSSRSTSPPTGASSGRSTRCCAAPPPAGSRSSPPAQRAGRRCAPIGALTRLQRRRSTPSPAPTPRRPSTLRNPRHAHQPGAAANRDARDGHARRRSGDAARARGTRAQDRRDLLARLDGDRQVVRFSFGSDSELQISCLSDDGRQIDLADLEPPLY